MKVPSFLLSTGALEPPEEAGRLMTTFDDLHARIEHDAAAKAHRLIVAIAGPPASGKSTLAADLVDRLGARAALFPMDGYHRDNDWLDNRGLRAHKGAPETFDVMAYRETLRELRADLAPVAVPAFDRALDRVIDNAAVIGPDHRIVVTEGNYLLLDQDPWRQLWPQFDLSVFLDVGPGVLETRLIQRWTGEGFDLAAARAKAAVNDLPNAGLVRKLSLSADITLVA